MKIFSLLFLIALIFFSCQEPKENLSKREYYEKAMKEKNFSLTENGPCDDALEDTLHERNRIYVENQQSIKGRVIVEFKFKAACCQEFLGDYTRKNDTLFLDLEQVNDGVCSCLCWYRYKLELDEAKEDFSQMIFRRI